MLLCGTQRLLAGNNALLLAILADQSDLLVGDLLVQLMLYLANTEAPPIQNKNADAPGIRETTQTALSGACMTLLTSLPLLEVRRMHRPSLFSRIFYTIPACLSTAFSRIFLHIFCGGGETMVVPEVQRVQKMEVYLMDNTKNTKNTKNTNTTDNTENTNTKNAKNAKNCK